MHFRHAKECRDDRALRYEGWKLGVSVVIFWTLSALIPLYNKVVFSGLANDEGFPFPATTAFLQLFFCAVVLSIYDVTKHFVKSRCWSKGNDDAVYQPLQKEQQHPMEYGDYHPTEESWLFGPNFRFKLRVTFPIGALFGIKYGVTNWGLQLLPLAPHLLLQATDLMWTVLFARFVNHEKLTYSEMLTCFGSTTGTLLIAWHTHQTMPDSMYSILVNLTSPILLGLCITTLRKASHKLLVREAGIGGRVQKMSPFELSAFKLWISSMVIFPVAFLFENGGGKLLFDIDLPGPNVTAFQVASQERPALGFAALLGGLFVLIFQVNVTWLSKMATAVTVGMVGGLKIIPQWVIALLFATKVDFNILNISGALLLLGSSIAWSYLRYDPGLTRSSPNYERKMRRRKRTCSTSGRISCHSRSSDEVASSGNDSNASQYGSIAVISAATLPGRKEKEKEDAKSETNKSHSSY